MRLGSGREQAKGNHPFASFWRRGRIHKHAVKDELTGLYRYTRIDDHLYELLLDAKVYFANAREMNDPDEAMLRFNRRIVDPDDPRWPMQTAIPTEYMSVGNYFYFCMSRRHDDVALWSHYADIHRGVCLEFDFSGARPQEPSRREQPWKLEDGADCIWIDSVTYVDDPVCYCLAPNGEPNLSPDEAADHPFYKLSCWKHEEEVRARLPINDGSDRQTVGPEGQKWAFERWRLRSIYFGLRVSEAERKRITRLAIGQGFACSFYRAIEIVFRENRHTVLFEPA